MKALDKLAWNAIKIAWRTPIAFFFVLLFPIGFFFLYAGIFAHGKPASVALFFGPVLTFMALTNGLFGNGAMTVMMRGVDGFAEDAVAESLLPAHFNPPELSKR